MKVVNDFWNMKRRRPNRKLKASKLKSKPSFRLKPVEFFKIKRVPQKRMNWAQARRFKRLKPFGDRDKDKVPNFLDCKPFNRKKHDTLPSFAKERYRRKYEKDVIAFLEKGKKVIEREEFKYGRKLRHGGKLTQERYAKVTAEGLYPSFQSGREHFTGGKFDTRLIIDKKAPVGERMKGFVQTLSTKKPRVGELDVLYVEPGSRRKGWGRQAIRGIQRDPKYEKYVAKAIGKDFEKWEKLGAKKISKEQYEETTSLPTDIIDEELKRTNILPGTKEEDIVDYIEIESSKPYSKKDLERAYEIIERNKKGVESGKIQYPITASPEKVAEDIYQDRIDKKWEKEGGREYYGKEVYPDYEEPEELQEERKALEDEAEKMEKEKEKENGD